MADPADRLFARLYDPVTAVAERTMFAPHRDYLTRGLNGRVLDVGVGTGRMLPHVADVPGIEYYGIDDNRHMLAQARKRAASVGMHADLVTGVAEELPFPEDAFDVVIASMVLCTVSDVDATLDEVRRVLRPRGELRVFEHVEAEGTRRVVQHGIEPVWRRLAGGCHVTRNTDELLMQTSGFEPIELDRFSIGITPVRPFVRGRFQAHK